MTKHNRFDDMNNDDDMPETVDYRRNKGKKHDRKRNPKMRDFFEADDRDY